MKKKIILVIIVFSTLVACGKKGDPVYKESQNNSKIPSYLLNRA
tara:strand:+ start:53 stop:184 length:132 start_codon:yes stop_codon:yes gene_type:complete